MSFTRDKKVEIKDVPIVSSKYSEIVYAKISYANDPSKVFRGFSVKREDGNYSMLTSGNLSKKVQFTDASLRKGICGISVVVAGVEEHAVPVGCNNLTEQMLEDAGVKIVRPAKGAPWCDIDDCWYLFFADDDTIVEDEVTVVHELSSRKVHGDGIPLVTPYQCSSDADPVPTPALAVPAPDADPVTVTAPDAIDDSSTDLFGEDEHMAIFDKKDNDDQSEIPFYEQFHQQVVVPLRPLHQDYSLNDFIAPPTTGMSEEEIDERIARIILGEVLVDTYASGKW